MSDVSKYTKGIRKYALRDDEDLSTDYFYFLMNITGLDDEYEKLCEVLHGINFRFDEDKMLMDENRIWDGKAMRAIFCEAIYPVRAEYRWKAMKQLDDCFDKDFCSVLEVLVGLAWRIERDIIGDPEYGDRTSLWVKCMIENLDLLDFTNENLKTVSEKEEVTDIIDVFLDREYDRFGNGSPFPVHYPRKNMRNVEIWNQMIEWLDENVYS